MELTFKIVLVLHFIGIASLLGGFLTQMSAMKTGLRVVPAILHGSWLLLITGFALTGLAYADTASEEQPNGMVIGIKSMVITAIFFIAYFYNKKGDATPKWAVPTIGLLTIVNISIAVIVGVLMPK